MNAESASSTDQRHHRVARAAGVNSAATAASRVLGLARDMTLSFYFGTTVVSSAFLFAFAMPNLLRRLFGEGAMAGSFVPLFAEEIHSRGRCSAFEAASSVLTILGTLLSIVAVAVSAACLVVAALLPAADGRLTLILTALMMPYAVVICLAAVCGAMLNTFGHFSRPALSPVLLNIAIIAAAWLGSVLTGGEPRQQIIVVALGVLAGGVLQLWLQIPALRRRGFNYRFVYGFASPFVRRIALLMAPAIVGVGVTQINIMVDRLLARIVNDRGVAVLFYADRLVELPLGVFGVAIATAVLPTISFCAARGNDEGFGAAVGFAARQICFIVLPAAVGLMLLAEPIIRLLFERGQFDAASTMYTARALQLYAPGLLGFSFVKILVPSFYALKDTRTPVRIGVMVLLLNVTLNLILMQFMEERGLALSTTICAYVNVLVLGALLHGRMGTLRFGAIAYALLRLGVLSACMGISVWFCRARCEEWFGIVGLWPRLVSVLVPIGVGMTVYVVLAFVTRQAELMELLRAYFARHTKA